MYLFLLHPVYMYIQGVSEISALILTGNRTHQKEQLFSLPFWRKTMFNSKKKKKLERFFTKIARFTRVLKWPTRAKKDPIYTQIRQINYY
jgi:hypothetical protein